MAGWCWTEVLETIADVRGDATALRNGDDTRTWRSLQRRTAAFSEFLVSAGLGHQAKVAQYLYNGNEYLESALGAVRAGMVPVNTNYRYVADELVYLWDNADVEAVVHHGAFVPVIEQVRARVPRVREWLWVDDGTEPCPPWATPYEAAADARTTGATPPWSRSGDDLVLQYTGGTTGRPKGVMWRQDDLYRFFSDAALGDPAEPDLDAVRRRVADAGDDVALPAAPLMHATSAFVSYQTLFQGGAVSTLTSRSLDAEELLDVVVRDRVTFLSIVGDVFARPLVDALTRTPGRWDLTGLRVVLSSGVMWSEPVKEQLLDLVPDLTLVDVFASSEALAGGRAVARRGRGSSTASFRAGRTTRVVRDDGTDVEPGSGEVGLIAIGGYVPVGYYKDEERSAATFRTIDGVRYSVPGDHATVEADGSLRLLGRGSNCINTGGEKVYPEEVEEVLKAHPSVRDAAVVGVADDRFGEVVGAVVELVTPGAAGVEDLDAHVRARLAGFKVPRRVVVDVVDRAANGKLDYASARRRLAGGPGGDPPVPA